MEDELNIEEAQTSRLNSRTVLRIIGLAKSRLPLLVGFIVLIFITSVGEAAGTYIVKHAIDSGILAGDRAFFIRLMLWYLGLTAVIAASVFGFIYCAGFLGEYIAYDLRKNMFAHLQQLSFSFFDKNQVGQTMARVTSDSMRIADLATWGLLDLTLAITNISASIIFMLTINWKLTLWVVAIVPILVFVGARFKRKIITEYRDVRAMNSKITGAYNENITGVRVVKALVRERTNLKQFSELTTTMFKKSYRAAWLSALFLPIVHIISAIGIGAILLFGGNQVKMGAFTIGGIQAFVGYITLMLWPVQDISRVYAEMQHSIASAERVFELLDTKPEIKDIENAVDLRAINGRIDFERVSFFYEEGKPVLDDFNFQVNPGETIALVGPTGGGKTTIVNLACRFYEPTSGIIRIDGRDYREYTLASLQRRLGVVLQTPHLFSGTIRENILYGRLDATEEEMIQAAKASRAHRFIEELERGYEEQVGEGGALLSVGQKQLISLARAILAQPQLIVMDEATSSVDTITETLIQEGIAALLADCTAFVIAHRLSTIRNADRILVIEEGKIREEGNHKELMALKGHYYTLFTQQYQSERERDLKLLG